MDMCACLWFKLITFQLTCVTKLKLRNHMVSCKIQLNYICMHTYPRYAFICSTFTLHVFHDIYDDAKNDSSKELRIRLPVCDECATCKTLRKVFNFFHPFLLFRNIMCKIKK